MDGDVADYMDLSEGSRNPAEEPCLAHSAAMDEVSLPMNKYRNKRHNGYASKREAELAANLQALEHCGKISGLTRQYKFVLITAQKGAIRNERPVTYTADFVYTDDLGNRHVIDAKGFKTQQYVIRRKLMKFIHNIEVEEL